MTKPSNPHAAILHKCREVILLMNVHLNHFPKHEKYGLCQQIRQAAYDVYGLLVECQKRYNNKTSLARLDVRHEQLRMFINLGFEMGYYLYHNSKQDRLSRLASIIGNALRSSTFAHFCKRVFAERPDLVQQLPFSKWRVSHVYKHQHA